MQQLTTNITYDPMFRRLLTGFCTTHIHIIFKEVTGMHQKNNYTAPSL